MKLQAGLLYHKTMSPTHVRYTCMPKTFMLFFSSSHSNSEVVTEVKAPEVFNLPSFCEGVELEEAPEGQKNDFFSLFNSV